MPRFPDERARLAFEGPRGTYRYFHTMEVIERPGWYQTRDRASKEASRNEVVHSEIPAGDAERVLRETIAEHEARGAGLKWCVTPFSSPEGFGELLLAHGFEGWSFRTMCLEPARATVRGPAGFVAEVLDEASIPAFARHSVRAWNLLRTDPVELETSVRQALRVESPRFLTWVVRERPNGEILASATLAVKDEGIGYLMTAVVDPAHRRRGFYKLLLERRLAEARRLGLGLVVTWARETTSAPLLESFGFDTVFLGQAFARRGP